MITPNPSATGQWEFPAVPQELITQEWCMLHRLIDDLCSVQKRLGTPLEEAEDYIHVRDLGHRIRNKLHLVQLWAELGMVPRCDVLNEAAPY
jgi:hypothetical protein